LGLLFAMLFINKWRRKILVDETEICLLEVVLRHSFDYEKNSGFKFNWSSQAHWYEELRKLKPNSWSFKSLHERYRWNKKQDITSSMRANIILS
jgi:hypothetical protein